MIKVNEENFLCERNDEIDNAVFDMIVSVVRYGSEDKSSDESIREAIHVLTGDVTSADSYEPSDAFMEDIRSEILDRYKDETTPEWNMQVIGDITDMIEYQLGEEDIPYCHPFTVDDEDDDEDDDVDDESDEDYDCGCICYRSEDRCEWCKRK